MNGIIPLLAAALLLCLAVAVPSIAASSKPEQIHIALAGRDANGYPNGVSVTWYTQNEAQGDKPTVQYGTKASGSLDKSATGTTSSYLADHGFHHVVTITGLDADTEYVYRVGDGSNGYSDTFTFRTPRSDPDHAFNFSVFGDMGWLGSDKRPMIITMSGLKKNWTAVPTRQVLERLKNDKVLDMIWHVGDIGYMDDAFAHDPVKFVYEHSYNGYMNWLQNLTTGIPYMVSPGNHESECHSPVCILEEKYGQALRNFTAYNHRWNMPSSTSDGVLNMWYSFNLGPVHFISMNTETDFPGAGEENTGDSHDPLMPAGHFGRDGQYLAWLEADLQQAQQERHIRPWIFAGGHRPFPEIQKNGVAELFEKYHVDFYFAGHSHSYSRSMPANTTAVEWSHPSDHVHNANGTIFIVAGGAGCDEMTDIGWERAMANGTTPVPSNSEVFATSKLASGFMQVVNRTAVHFQLIGSHTDQILDQVWVTKSL